MWRRRDQTDVTCIACGDHIDRSAAREYDKYGDRWDRRNKEFEHLCKPCHRHLCHHARPDLEALLTTIETGSLTQTQFLQQYRDRVEREHDSPESHK